MAFLLLPAQAGAAVVVTLRGDAPNAFGNGSQPTEKEFDVNGDGVFDYLFIGDYFVAAIQSYGANRFISTLEIPPDLGGNVSPIEYGIMVGLETKLPYGEWHHSSDGGSIGAPVVNLFYSLNNGPRSLQFSDAYIGVEFAAADGIHYGWIQYLGYDHPEKGLGRGLPGGFINSWAWETQPGVAIIAGAIPEPSAIALIAMAGAFLFLRRRKS